jgi:hypothetical protein
VKRVAVGLPIQQRTGMHAHTHECMLDALASKLCYLCNRAACVAAALCGVLVASQPTIFGCFTLQAATKKSILHARHYRSQNDGCTGCTQTPSRQPNNTRTHCATCACTLQWMMQLDVQSKTTVTLPQPMRVMLVSKRCHLGTLAQLPLVSCPVACNHLRLGNRCAGSKVCDHFVHTNACLQGHLPVGGSPLRQAIADVAVCTLFQQPCAPLHWLQLAPAHRVKCDPRVLN